MNRAYYNEIDPYAASWLKDLIKDGQIASGYVDERSILDVRPADLAGFTQCHWFAGIGGWPLALRAAGWPDDRQVWSGSCPCQPFSTAGKGRGFDDARHLWPAWFRLICECNPASIFGEQVASATDWLDLVLSDLESQGYACGAADLPASGFGAWHFRPRFWFFADSDEEGWSDVARLPAPETERGFRGPSWVACREGDGNISGPPELDESWVVDGLPGAGFAVGALGNAIDQRPAKAFIQAVMAILATE